MKPEDKFVNMVKQEMAYIDFQKEIMKRLHAAGIKFNQVHDELVIETDRAAEAMKIIKEVQESIGSPASAIISDKKYLADMELLTALVYEFIKLKGHKQLDSTDLVQQFYCSPDKMMVVLDNLIKEDRIERVHVGGPRFKYIVKEVKE